MIPAEEALKAILEVAGVLEDLQVPYAVGSKRRESFCRSRSYSV